MDILSQYQVIREERFKKAIEEFKKLPEGIQKKLGPVLKKTLERHEEIGRNLKVCMYYTQKHDPSLILGVKLSKEDYKIH